MRSFVVISIGIFILMIPCILYVLSWYLHRKLEINHLKTSKVVMGNLGNTINNKPNWLRNLRLSARIISLFLIVCFAALVIMMGLLFNRPAPASDYIILGSCSIYVIGLFIGFKWERLGGSISLTYLSIIFIGLIVSNISGPHVDSFVGVYIGIFILMIPCILFILSWYYHRKSETNHLKTE